MRVLIVGAGEVGSSIAASLADTHEVVVVDTDPDRVERLTYAVDVLAIEGDGTDLSVLQDAEVERADIVIASTDADEVNLAVCTTVKTFTEAFTIARVKRTHYLETWNRSHGAFGVDSMVCTDLLSAQAIVRVIGLPTARDVDPFAGGRVQMAEVAVPAESPIANQTVREADRFEKLTFAAVLRDGEVEIATGDTVIEPGDQVVVIGTPESVRAFAADVSPADDDVEDVVVVGGSAIGRLLAELLERRGYRPRLVEQDPERARELAEALPGTTVLEHDATDMDFLEREHVGEADVVVSTLDSDERSLLVSLLAKRLGVDRTIALVTEPQYVDLFETVGVDVAVNPRKVTAEEMTRFTRGQHTENVAIIESDAAEVLEIEIEEESALAGRPIRETVPELSAGLVIGAIARGDDILTPRGDTVVEPGDNVVVFVDADDIDEVTELL
jgi:trk system potassium uptake protein TrkA